MGKKCGKRCHFEGYSRWAPYSRNDMIFERSSSSGSSSESEKEFGHKNKKWKKNIKKHFKHLRKFGHRLGYYGHHYSQNDQMSAPVVCTLCSQRIRPLIETEILECGHIYHRLCLKQLIQLADNAESQQSGVLCTQCKHKIDDNLLNEFKTRLNGTQIVTSMDDNN